MQRKHASVLLFSMAAWLALASHAAIAYDPYGSSNRYSDTVSGAQQPTFGRQWWDVDEKGLTPQEQLNRTNTTNRTGNGSVNCSQVSRDLRQLRALAQDEARRYASCLERADYREDCSRDFDTLRRAQQDHEDLIRDIGRNCR